MLFIFSILHGPTGLKIIAHPNRYKQTLNYFANIIITALSLTGHVESGTGTFRHIGTTGKGLPSPLVVSQVIADCLEFVFLLLLKVGHHVVACSRPCFFPAWTGKRASLCLSLSLDVINYYFSIKTKLFLAVVSRWVELAVHIISIFHSFLIDYTNYN